MDGEFDNVEQEIRDLRDGKAPPPMPHGGQAKDTASWEENLRQAAQAATDAVTKVVEGIPLPPEEVNAKIRAKGIPMSREQDILALRNVLAASVLADALIDGIRTVPGANKLSGVEIGAHALVHVASPEFQESLANHLAERLRAKGLMA